MKQKVLVTGANGYIGKNVINYLLNNNIEVVAADISLDKINDKVKKIEANIFENTDYLFSNLRNVDTCIHLAWRNGFVHKASHQSQTKRQ